MKFIKIFSLLLFTSFFANAKSSTINSNKTKKTTIIGICGGWKDVKSSTGQVIGKYRNCWSIVNGSYTHRHMFDQQ